MLKKLNGLLHQPNSLKSASGILAITLFLSNVLGLVRNIVLASKFTPEELDIYYAGFQIPNLIFNLLVFGAITTAFIPVFSELVTQKKIKESWRLTSEVFTLVTLVLVSLSLLMAILMPILIRFVVPGFDEQRMAEAVLISRIMLLQSLIFGWSYIIGGVINTYKRFTTYAIAPLLYNLSIIIGALLGDSIGIRGVAWAVVIGALLHLLIQYPTAWQIGFRWRFTMKFFSSQIKQIFRLMVPRSLSLGFQQLNILVFTAIASTLTGGAIAVFNLTNDFQTTPVVIFANSLAVALFPTLTELASKKDWQEFEQVLGKSLRITIFFLIPSAFIMFILRAQIMRLYVGLGKGFDWEATKMAITTLAYFSLGIVPSGIVAIFSRVFYAMKNTKLPMYFGAISIFIAIVTALIFKKLGVGGLALSLSLSSIVNAILLIIAYNKLYQKNLNINKIINTTLISFTLSLVMSLVIWLSLRFVDAIYHFEEIPTSTHQVFGLFVQTVIALSVGIIIYGLLAFTFQKEEIGYLTKKNQK